MTITEMILVLHAGRDSVKPRELVEVNVDLAMANDITAPLTFRVFDELGADRVFDPEKIALVPDHFVPNKDIPSAQQAWEVLTFDNIHPISAIGPVRLDQVFIGSCTSGRKDLGLKYKKDTKRTSFFLCLFQVRTIH